MITLAKNLQSTSFLCDKLRVLGSLQTLNTSVKYNEKPYPSLPNCVIFESILFNKINEIRNKSLAHTFRNEPTPMS